MGIFLSLKTKQFHSHHKRKQGIQKDAPKANLMDLSGSYPFCKWETKRRPNSCVQTRDQQAFAQLSFRDLKQHVASLSIPTSKIVYTPLVARLENSVIFPM